MVGLLNGKGKIRIKKSRLDIRYSPNKSQKSAFIELNKFVYQIVPDNFVYKLEAKAISEHAGTRFVGQLTAL